MTRAAGSVLAQAKQRMTTRASTQDAIDALVALAEAQRARVADNDATGIGPALHDAWQLKKQMATRVTSSLLDGYYDRGRKAGATGGKIVGAGGGGCLLLAVPPRRAASVRRAMAKAACARSRRARAGGTTIIHASDWEAPAATPEQRLGLAANG